MIKDIQKVQKELEGKFFAFQPLIEKIALKLSKSDPKLLIQFLTDYSVGHGEQVVKRWRELGEYLLTKYSIRFVYTSKIKFTR